MIRASSRDEHGQTALLILGFFVVAVLLVGVVVDASAAYLHRQALTALADGAALAAADGIRSERVYTQGLGGLAHIDPAAAERHVRDYLAASGAGQRFPGLTWRLEAGTTSVTVRLSAPLDLPIPPPGGPDSAVVTGTGSSVVIVR